jgi:hypothetical protein
MLYMGYKLTSDIQQKIIAKDISDVEPEQLKVWEKITEKQIVNTRFFMGFSFLFLIGGLAILVIQHRPDTKVILSFTPMEKEFPPIMYAQENMVTLDENGKGWALFKHEHALTIDNKVVFDELKRIRKDLSVIEASERALVQQTTIDSSDAGYGDIFL